MQFLSKKKAVTAFLLQFVWILGEYLRTLQAFFKIELHIIIYILWLNN